MMDGALEEFLTDDRTPRTIGRSGPPDGDRPRRQGHADPGGCMGDIRRGGAALQEKIELACELHAQQLGSLGSTKDPGDPRVLPDLGGSATASTPPTTSMERA